MVGTAKDGIILAAVHHEKPVHDNHSLPEVLERAMWVRDKPIKAAICDRGYRGKRQFGDTTIILPGAPLKRDNRYQRDKKRKRCRRRAAIEPLIGHLKSDHRLDRCYLKGSLGDAINLLMAACAWNLKKWLALIFWLLKMPAVERQPLGNGDDKANWATLQALAALAIGLAIAEAASTMTRYPF